MFKFVFIFSFHTGILILSWIVDPVGAREKVLEIASSLGIRLSVAVAHEVFVNESGMLIKLAPFKFKLIMYENFAGEFR